MNDVLHLSTYEYNVACMFTILREVALKNGCKIVEASRYKSDIFKNKDIKTYIVNGSLEKEKKKLSSMINRIKSSGYNAVDYEYKLNKIASINNMPRCVISRSKLQFVFNGTFYGIYIPEINPFFNDIRYAKTPVLDGNKVYDVLYETLCLNWPQEALISEYQTDVSELKRISEFLLKTLLSAKETKNVYVRRVKVPNLYDGKFHIETVKETMNLFNR